MTLYNFFSKKIKADDLENMKDLNACFIELKPICHFVKMVSFIDNKGEEYYTIIGQRYGTDYHNGGDDDLLWIFKDIKCTWFEADFPTTNNIKEITL